MVSMCHVSGVTTAVSVATVTNVQSLSHSCPPESNNTTITHAGPPIRAARGSQTGRVKGELSFPYSLLCYYVSCSTGGGSHTCMYLHVLQQPEAQASDCSVPHTLPVLGSV